MTIEFDHGNTPIEIRVNSGFEVKNFFFKYFIFSQVIKVFTEMNTFFFKIYILYARNIVNAVIVLLHEITLYNASL